MTNRKLLDDLVTLGSAAISNITEARHELKAQAKQRAGSVVRGLDLVTRDEFDAAFAMLAKARNIQEDLAARLAKIEGYLGLSSAKKLVKTKKANLLSVKSSKTRSKRK